MFLLNPIWGPFVRESVERLMNAKVEPDHEEFNL